MMNWMGLSRQSTRMERVELKNSSNTRLRPQRVIMAARKMTVMRIKTLTLVTAKRMKTWIQKKEREELQREDVGQKTRDCQRSRSKLMTCTRTPS